MPETFDVFLSYHTLDVEAVRAVADNLRRQDLKPFLDRWYLTPGQPWVPELERALADCRAVAVFIGPQGMGPWQQRERDAALDRQSHTQGFPLIPVLLPGADPALGFLGQSMWVDLRSGVQDEFGLKLLLAGIRGQPPGPELEERLASTRAAVCPYRGLLYFREEDAPFFFGREAAIGQLAEAVGHHRFLAAVGASGSGKSSAVRAGLVPALRRARDTVWEIATLVPGDQPLKALADALTPLLFPELDAIDRSEKSNKLAARFAEGSVPLRDMVKEALARQPGTQRLLIVADQWEELYTLTNDDAVRRRFMDELLDATERSPLTVVVTLRGDFVGKALAYRPLSDRLQGAQVNLGPMTREELQRAIEQPASKVGLSLEPGLVQRILNDVGGEPGNLPLLEFVLKQLWDARRGLQLLNRAYDDMGRLQGAIAQRAERFFKALSLAEQETIRRLFLQLIHVAEDGQETRRRERLANLPEAAHPLVERLSGSREADLGQEPERLLVTARDSSVGGESVEVAHEALIRNWERLVDWLKADRKFLLWRERLRALLEAFNPADLETLLRGPMLDEAELWFVERAGDLSEAERKFIGDSLEGRRQRREKERRQRRWLLGTTIALALACIIAGVFYKRERALREKVQWQATAAEQKADVEKRRADLAETAKKTEQEKREASEQKARLAEEERRFAEQIRSNTVAQLNAIQAEIGFDLPDDDGTVRTTLVALQSMRLQPTQLAAEILHRGLLALKAKPEIVLSPTNHPANVMRGVLGVRRVAFSPDSNLLATASEDGTTRLWTIRDWKERAVLNHYKEPETVSGQIFESPSNPTQLTFSRDGRRLCTVDHEAGASVWDVGTAKPLARVPADWAYFTDRGESIVVVGHSGRIAEWDFRKADYAWKTNRHGDATATGFDESHSKLAVGGWISVESMARALFQIWDVRRGVLDTSLPVQGDATCLAFSPDGLHLAAGFKRSQDGMIFETATGLQVGLLLHNGTVDSVAWSPDGKHLATKGGRDELRIWSMEGEKVSSKVIQVSHADFSGDSYDRAALVFSPDSKYLITTLPGSRSRVWEVATGRELARLPATSRIDHENTLDLAAFSPDGSRVAMAIQGEALVFPAWWLMDPMDAAGRHFLTRNLTTNEWRHYFPNFPYAKTCPDLR